MSKGNYKKKQKGNTLGPGEDFDDIDDEMPLPPESDSDFPESEKASRSVLSLPMHPYLTEEELEKTTTVIKSYFIS